MSRRAGIATLVLILWVGGIAALVHRETFRDPAERLAMAGLLVTPGTEYYAVLREGEHVGFSSFMVDTAAAGIELHEYTVFDYDRGADGPIRMARRLRAEATWSLKLVRFRLDEQAGDSVRTVRGEVEGDSVLVLVTSGDDGTAAQQRVKLDHPVLPSSAVTFALALARSARVGRSYEFAALDPWHLQPRTMRLHVIGDSTMIVADSATAGLGGRWVPARTDTVRAWRVQEVAGTQRRMWVDVAGRVISREFDGGFSEERMAFELAYLNWPGNRFLRRASAGVTDSNSLLP